MPSLLENLITSLEQAPTTVLRGRNALTAASSPLQDPQRPSGRRIDPDALRSRRQGWQIKILQYAREVPEVAGGAAIVRGAAEGVRLVASGGNADTRADLQARLDGFDLGRAVELIWLTGETYIGWPDIGRPYSLSIDELTPHANPVQVRGPRGMVDMRDPYFRIWKPANQNRYHATSPNEAALDLIEAMFLHQVADSAVAMSRLAGAGIMFWPTSLKSMPVKDDGTPERGSREELLLKFHNAAMQSIDNRKSAEATIPFVFFYDPEDGNYQPEILRIDKDDRAAEYELRFNTYRLRYAAATELPIESQTGMGDTNHWSAWAIREDKYHYLAPLFEIVREGIERRVVEHIDPRLKITIDAEKLIKKPDQTETVMQLLALQIIDPAAAFEILGLDAKNALPYQKKDYTSNVLPSTPSDFKVGGDRGGGRYRDRA